MVANLAFALLFGIGANVKPLAGVFGDRFSKLHLSRMLLVFGGISLAGMIRSSNQFATMVFVVGFSVGFMAYPPLMTSYLMDVVPDENQVGDLGAMRTMFIGIGSLGSTYVGLAVEWLDYTMAFGSLVLLLFVSAAVIHLLSSCGS